MQTGTTFDARFQSDKWVHIIDIILNQFSSMPKICCSKRTVGKIRGVQNACSNTPEKCKAAKTLLTSNMVSTWAWFEGRNRETLAHLFSLCRLWGYSFVVETEKEKSFLCK